MTPFRLAFAAVLAAILALPARAATDSVTNISDDFSAGSLPSAVSSNTFANGGNGGDTIQWNVPASSTTIFLVTPLAQISTATLDFSLANASATIAGAAIAISSNVTFNVVGQAAAIVSVVNNGSVAGTVVKTGTGTLALYGANAYSGGTMLNAGTLQLNNLGALGSGSLYLNGGTLAFNVFGATITNSVFITSATIDLLGNNAAISSVIAGSGGLHVANSTGTLALSGANTFTGGVTVDHGATLNINADAALGDAANTLTLSDASTLQLANSMTVAHPISLGSGGGIIDTQGFAGTLSGLVSGTGGLTKNGSGSLTLGGTAANTYSGGTTINAGTVISAGNNALGTGSITMANGTVLNLGSNTQAATTVTGNAGTLQMTLLGNPGSITPGITASGNVNLTNTTLQVTLPVQTIKALGQNYVFTPIQAGSMTGTPTVVGPAVIQFSPSIVGNNLQLTGTIQKLSQVAATGNQAAIGAMLLPAQTNPTGDLSTVLQQIYSMNSSQVQAALDQLSPVSLGAMSSLGAAQASMQSAAVSRRMAALADGSARDEFSHYAVAPKSSMPGNLYAEPPGDTPEDDRALPPELGRDSRWGFFSAADFTAGKVQELTSDAGVQPGFAFNTAGVTFGSDYRFVDGFAGGVSIGYLHGHTSLYAPSAGTIDNNSLRYGVYGVQSAGNFHADLYLGGASDHFSTRRAISIGAINRTASGSPSATELNVRPSVSYDQEILDWGIFSPFAVLDYDRMAVNSFTETGADSLDLSVDKQTAESAQSTLGLRYSQKFFDGVRHFVPYGSLGWRHEYDPQRRPITAQLASGGGSQFSTVTGNIARDGTLIGLGLSVDWTKNLMAKADWAGDFRSHYQDSLFNVSLRYRF